MCTQLLILLLLVLKRRERERVREREKRTKFENSHGFFALLMALPSLAVPLPMTTLQQPKVCLLSVGRRVPKPPLNSRP